MFVFKQKQETFDFGGIRIGGNPGERPTVLIGGLFFEDQKVVHDANKGTFDEALAKQWIALATDMSDRTGHPFMIQVYGKTPEAMDKHISWLAENFEGPFLFESTSSAARIKGIELCRDIGLNDRAIFNSLNLATKDEETALLQQNSLDKAVVLGWAPRATNLEERMRRVTEMIEEAKRVGVTKMLIDPATMPVGAGYGLDYRTVLAVKSELGLPTCLAPHNAVSSWRFLKEPDINKRLPYLGAIVASTTAAQLLATDCVMFGSMKRSREIFIAASLIANAIASSIAEANRVLGEDRDLFVPPTYE